MANEAHKIKLLVLWDILCKNTDENHALNTDEISELLALRGLNVSRKILVQDIATLCDNGYDVLSYIGYLFGQYQPYMWWVLLATAGVWSIVMGVFFAIAQKNEDTQEPIIDEETFWAVQKIREGKRRLDSLGEPNALSGMLFCGDCGHRLYLRRQRDSHQKDYFVCSVYRKKRKYFCTSHFIRLADIEKILLRDLRQVTAFAREHESEFLDLAKKRSLRETEKLRAENKASLDKAVRRIAEIDGIIQKLYEDNVSGKISDERFAKMAATYEAEQDGLQQTAQRLKDEISAVREEGESVDRFMKLVNKYSDITELNAEIIRTFVEKIIVYEAEKNDGIKTQRVKIVYNCVGTVSVPNIDNEPVKTDKTKIIEVA